MEREYDFDPMELVDKEIEHCQCPGCDGIYIEVDNGIGSYEFWGQKCTHHEWDYVCNKCGHSPDERCGEDEE